MTTIILNDQTCNVVQIVILINILILNFTKVIDIIQMHAGVLKIILLLLLKFEIIVGSKSS